MRHDSIAFEIQKSTWIRQKQLDRNIKELRYDRNKEYLYGEFKHYLAVNEHYDTNSVIKWRNKILLDKTRYILSGLSFTFLIPDTSI